MKDRKFKVTAIIAAYNEEDIIAQTVGDLIRQGIFVYFIDNHSTDETVARIIPFLATGLLQIEKFPSCASPENTTSYHWEAILRHKEELAGELDSDWFIHHDADEFRECPWVHLNLLEGIQTVDRMGYNAIDFEVFEFQPTHNHFMYDQDIRETFEYYDQAQWYNKIRINCWKKTATPVELSLSGGHQAEFQDRRIFPVRFILRHYPVRSQAHGERKVFKDRFPRFLKSEREKNWHIQYDHVSKGHCFIRDASTLTRYDAEKVRFELILNHREVENFQQIIGQRNDEISNLHQTNQAVLEELSALRFQVDSEVRLLELRLASEQAKGDHLLLALEDARQEVRALRSSWSWRITAPLRKVYDFLSLHRRNKEG